MKRKTVFASILVAGLVFSAPLAQAKSCGNTSAGFNSWLTQFSKKAQSRGISKRTLKASLKGVTYDRRVVKLDRSQSGFKVSYKTFLRKRVTAGRISKGKRMLKKHARLLAGIKKRYGVPPEIIVAIWGMETDFGVNRGRMNVFRSLATLSYDCRRSKFFTEELMAALTIVQRGWMRSSSMRGAWAGELGQTQFLATNYIKYAVDYNGDGRRDLVRSTADALASTANFLRGHGWRRGGGFKQGALRGWNNSSKYTRALAYYAGKLQK